MIVSASRRTDIPAFYSKWFMNRIRAGFCLVPNPFNSKQVSRVSLRPDDVDAIVFWSKNPAPMLRHLNDLEKEGFQFYFQFTVNDYLRELEPNVPPLHERLDTFRQLSNMIGSERVVWRYDPIIISNKTNYEFHRRRFFNLCKELAPFTKRVMISIVDFYAKTKRNLKKLEATGYRFLFEPENISEMPRLLNDIAKIAKEFEIDVFTCAEEQDYTHLGIPPGRCIDGKLVDRLWHIHRAWRKDPNQREACGCVISKDIGMNDTCPHNCPYCYATRDGQLACKRYAEHDPSSTALIGNPTPCSQKRNELQGCLFE